MIRRFVSVFALTLSIAAAAHAAVPLPEPSAPPLRFPAVSERTLPNGLRVVVFSRPLQPVVQVQLLVPAGGAYEPDSLAGLASLTASLVLRGTASRTAQQFDTDAAALGATLNASVNRDYALLVAGVRSTAFEQALELLADAAISPRFEDDAFASARHDVAQQLGRRRRDPAMLADDGLWAYVFGAHPYAHSPNGEIQSLLASGLPRVLAFHRERWRPDRAVLAIAGDVSAERAFGAAGDAFGRWGGRAAPDRPRPAPPATPGVRVVDLPGANRAEIRVGVRGPGRASPELPAWRLAAAALEQTFAPTATSVSFAVLHDASLLTLSASAPTDSAAIVTTHLRDALRGFAAAPPGGEALESIRRRVAQSAPLSLETIGALLSQWQAAAEAGVSTAAFESEFTPGEPAKLGDAVAAARAMAAVPPAILVAGPGEALRHALAGVGTVDVVPFEKPITAQADTLPAPTAEQLRLGRAAVAKAVLAAGGAAKLAAIRSITMEGSLTLPINGSDVSGQCNIVRVDPSRCSYGTKLLELESRQVLDGDTGWSLTLADTATFAELDSSGVASMRETFESDVIHMLRMAAAPGSNAALRGTGRVGLRTCDLVDFKTPSGRHVRLAFDQVNRRILAIDGVPAPDGAWRDRRQFGDYRQVGTLWLPFFEDRYADGEKASSFRAKVIALNTNLGAGFFKRPRVLHGQVLSDE